MYAFKCNRDYKLFDIFFCVNGVDAHKLFTKFFFTYGPRRDDQVISEYTSPAIDREFTPRLGHTKDHYKNASLLGVQA